MGIRINVNGTSGGAEALLLSPLDRGFLFGASVYETIRTYDNVPFLLTRHLTRLRESAAALAIPFDTTDEVLERRISQMIQEANNTESSIRIVVSAGVGPIDYRASKTSATQATVVVIVRPLPELHASLYEEGARAALVSVMRAAEGSLNPRIKSSNLLNNMMALREAQEKDAYEGLMLNSRGEVAEGSMSNVFLVEKGAIRTPPIDAGILEGITRELVIELARENGLTLEEQAVAPETLLAADEVFITASSRQIVPIVRVDEHLIADGRPGQVTRNLMKLYETKARLLIKLESKNPNRH